jgi:3-oxoacyl-[acyl-carrier protein] reductase
MSVVLSGPPDMTGKVVFVTGASGGIGRITVESLASAGAKVVATDIADLAQPFQSPNVAFLRYDVTSKQESETIVRRVIGEYGRIDVMVLCAGAVSNTPVDKVTDEEWDRVQDVNVMGVINPVRAVWQDMIAQGGGKFVLLGSVAVRIGGFAAGPAYTAAKAAVHGIGKWMAKHGAAHGITTNVVAPGPVVTPMFEEVTENRAPDPAKTIPLGRYGHPVDVAQAILFFASPQSNWMTGVVMNVNGGLVFD